MSANEIKKTELENFNGAKWIAQSYLADERPQECRAAAFRRDYHLSAVPQACILSIAAFRNCILWLNGKRIYNSHIRFFTSNVRYDRIDIAQHLKQGINSFAIILISPTGSVGYSEYARAGVILKADISDAFCNEQICTDSSWYSIAASWYGLSDKMISVPTVYQEHFNAYTHEPANWQTDMHYLEWSKAFAFGCAGVSPFKHMAERDIPFLTEKYIKSRCVWSGCDDRRKAAYPTELTKQFNSCLLKGRQINTSDEDFFSNAENNIFTFDYRKTSYIRPAVIVKNCSGNIRLEFYYSMQMSDRPNAYTSFGFDCEGFSDSYTPPEGDSEWTALFPKGFRFMTVRVCGEGSVSFRQISSLVSYPYGNEYSIEAKDPFFKVVWKMAAETLKSSTNDVIVDTCTRENVLWTFDAISAAKAAYYTFGELKMWKRCLLLIAEGVDADGNFKSIVPSEDSFMKLIDQNLFWIVSCAQYYDISKDKDFLADVAPKIRALLTLCADCITSEGLFSPPVFAWHWVDWALIDRRPYSLPINCILLIAADSALRIAGILNNTTLSKLAGSISAILRPNCERFFNTEKNYFVCRIEPCGKIPEYNPFNFLSDDQVTPFSIHAVCLACAAKIGTDEMRKSSMEALAKLINTDIDDERIAMGPGWIEILISVLVDYGYVDESKSYIKNKYGLFINSGAPTVGESFNKGEFNTAHAWGSCVNSLLARKKEAFGIVIKKHMNIAEKRM